MKREVAVKISNKPSIIFYATKDASDKFKDFGIYLSTGDVNLFNLIVDSRYDFDEVLAYIENYNEK